MTKGAAKGKRTAEENTKRREGLQLIRAGLLPKDRMIPGSSKNPRIAVDKFQEKETILKTRERWRNDHPNEVPPWEKFSMG